MVAGPDAAIVSNNKVAGRGVVPVPHADRNRALNIPLSVLARLLAPIVCARSLRAVILPYIIQEQEIIIELIVTMFDV